MGGTVSDSGQRIDVVQQQGAVLPTRTSYSQMSLYNQCALKYYFGYVARWKEPTTQALAVGSITHEIVEYIYRLEPQERTIERALDLMREHGTRLLSTPEYSAFASDNEVKQQIMVAVQNLFTVEDPTTVVVQPEHLEMELDVEIGGVKFTGKVDRLTVDGGNRVTDYKTGRSPGKYVNDKLSQPFLYALAFREQFGMEVDEVELIYLHAKETVRRDNDVAVMEAMGGKLVDMRAGAERDLASSSWTATPQRLCDWCAFQVACPARNAAAPTPGSPESDALLAQQNLLQR